MNLILNMPNFRCLQDIHRKMWKAVEYGGLELREEIRGFFSHKWCLKAWE